MMQRLRACAKCLQPLSQWAHKRHAALRGRYLEGLSPRLAWPTDEPEAEDQTQIQESSYTAQEAVQMMKQLEPTTVIVNLEMWHVERIWTEFRNDLGNRNIAVLFEAARQEAYRKDKQQAPDPAKIPVTVTLTSKQARSVLAAFKPYASFPSDGEVYTRVKKALDGE